MPQTLNISASFSHFNFNLDKANTLTLLGQVVCLGGISKHVLKKKKKGKEKGATETCRWRKEPPSSTLSLHMSLRDYVIVIAKGCLSCWSSMPAPKKKIATDKSILNLFKNIRALTVYICSVSYFLLLGLFKTGIVSLIFWIRALESVFC